METIRTLIKQYREQWTYLVVGVCTTAVNYIIYFALNGLGVYYIVSNVLAWTGAVVFAYFANGAWVYRSTSRRGVKEAAAFVASRLFSLGLETLLLFLMVELGRVDQNLAKILVAVVTVVVNYFTGKLVYKGKKGA